MKKTFAILIIFLICAIGKTATDSNNTIAPDSNNTAAPDTNTIAGYQNVPDSNNTTVSDANTIANYQKKIKQLEQGIKSQEKRLSKTIKALDSLKIQLDEQIEENERLRALLQEYIADSTSSVPFTGEETPLIAVKAYPEQYIGETFIVIGSISVSDSYRCNYEEARRTHVSLDLAELKPDKSKTHEYAHLYIRKEISEDLVKEITKTIYSGHREKLIRAKVSILQNPYDPTCGIQAELVNWQFLSADKNWQAWQIPYKVESGLIKGR